MTVDDDGRARPMGSGRWMGARLATCAALLAFGGCRAPAPPALDVGLPHLGDVEVPVIAEDRRARGAEDYLRSCAPCHGADGRGVGVGQTVEAPDLTRLHARPDIDDLRGYLVEVITGERRVAAHGSRDMPVWRRRFRRAGSGAEAVAALYAQRRLDALAAHVESLQKAVAP